MGLFDSILGNDGKSADTPQEGNKSSNPFSVQLSFSPLRLSANRKNSVRMNVRVKNISNDPQLVSVDALLPKGAMMGFDPACINKATEKRVGDLKAGDSIDVPIEIFGGNQTKEGNYGLEVTVFAHYIGYEKVIGYIKKSASLRVV
jgi:uncharacterized membrane protein